MQKTRTYLLSIASRVIEKRHITPEQMHDLLTFEKKENPKSVWALLKQTALPFSILFGALLVIFPEYFDEIAQKMPSWTNLHPSLLTGVDYMWNILSEPVGKANIMYHLPNIILYSFGILGIKKLFEALDRKSWLDRIHDAKSILRNAIQNGTIPFSLRTGHSILFVGKGDFIGAQFILTHKRNNAITVSEIKPAYTDIWSYYSADTTYQDLSDVLMRSDGSTAGEYIFFPVKDDQIFLPGPSAYDLSPHKLDIICQDIRMIERENKWKQKRIIIVGNREHKSYVRSEDKKKALRGSLDVVSLESIAKKYKNVTLLDPSDIVLRQIIKIARGRKVVFRATLEGLAEYKQRFYRRLEEMGYKTYRKTGILTIGYDMFEDQTEQQTLARSIDDYYPIVLSKNVSDALIRNGYKKDNFIYVPELVLQALSTVASEQ